MPIKKIKLPAKVYSLSLKPQKRTTYIQKPSGSMAGRKAVRGRGDGTRPLRMKQDFDVNKDRKITAIDLKKGQIIGLVPSGMPKPKRVEIKRHYRKSKKGLRKVKKHKRKVTK